LARFQFESETFWKFTFILVSCRELRCLSDGVQLTGVALRAVTRIVAGVGNLVQMTEYHRTDLVLGGRVIERSGGIVCGLHRARGDEKHGFPG
jgi:hypothetical protein